MAAVIRHSISRLAKEKELLRCLDCPTCKSTLMKAPIHYCERGHSVCSICLQNIEHCGICRAKISKARNYSLEAIVDISLFKCVYEQDGCKERIGGKDFHKHVEICEFRPVDCVFSCSTRQPIPLHTFVTHLVQNHDSEKWKISQPSFVIQSHVTSFSGLDCAWPLKCIEMKQNGEIFFKHERILDGVYSIWITYLGSERRAKDFTASLIIRSKKKDAHEIKWKVEVYSFRKSEHDLANVIQVLVPVEELETIATRSADGTLEWVVEYKINAIQNTITSPVKKGILKRTF